MAFYSKKYVRGVADYLAAGRVAGRYVISVGDMQSSVGVITLVALVEEQYQSGLGLGFWSGFGIPLGLILSLTGYCTYRFRETRSLSLGQFLEMRYSRPFRIFAASLRTLAEMMSNAIGPAVAARFFIYFLGIPHKIDIWGFSIPSFAVIMVLILILAMMIIWPGGRISLTITDCIQGLMSYPIFVIFAVYVFSKISFTEEVAPIMLNRVAGESFLNPFDVSELRDFNIFALAVGIFGNTLNRASWIGNDTSGSARNPHEQKMAGILGTWRAGFSWLMCILIGVVVMTIMNHSNYSRDAKSIRNTLTQRVANEVVSDKAIRSEVVANVNSLPEEKRIIGESKPLSRLDNPDTTFLDNVHGTLEKYPNGNAIYKEFRTLYFQMMMPITLEHIFPPILMGLFCLLMILLMLSTDDSRIFNAAATIIQDVWMPLRKKPFTTDEHLKSLKLCSVGVCFFFFFFSLFLSQLDYIGMFLVIMGSIWLGGAGPVMIFGLYSRFGTTAGAWTSLLAGSIISIGGLILQRNWSGFFYPLLDNLGWVEGLDYFLQVVSSPFAPYIVWRMDAVTFPINSREIYFFALISGILGYVIVSLMTYKKPFNLERMLHRGKYSIADEQKKEIKLAWSWSNLYDKIVGITPEYTTGDKVITYSVLFYSFIYQFGLAFLGVLIWNMISPWSSDWWTWYFIINNVYIATFIGGVSTIWFFIGGVIDMRQLFKDLVARKDDPLDDGWVENNVSLADKTLVDNVEHNT